MSLIDMPINVQRSVTAIKEAGALGLAIIIVCFYLGQQAGVIGNVDRNEHTALYEETKKQTIILIDNQKLLLSIVESTHINQIAFVQLARGICISVTKTADIEARCLSTH